MATAIPPNDALFTLAELVACTGGELRVALTSRLNTVRGICTDTRRMRRGEVFVAICGDHFDGHDHLSAAASAGAALALVERSAVPRVDLPLLVVPSTIAALGSLALLHMEHWRARATSPRMIAITGSAGKTTVRRVTAALLRQQLGAEQVHASRGNLNNLVGVPMVLLGLEAAHRLAVVELGTSAPGEIATLARMARPDIGVLTLIGAAHTSGLGDLAAVEREKASLLDELEGKAVIGNADDPRVMSAVVRSDAAALVTYGCRADADYRVTDRRLVAADRAELTITRATGKPLVARVPLVGRAGALACAAAVAATEVATGRAVSAESLAHCLERLPGNGRLEVRQTKDGLVVIDDSYNANPASTAAALEAACEIAHHLERRLVVVLGDMLELGDRTQAAHTAAGEQAAQQGAAVVVGVGAHAERTVGAARDAGVETHQAIDAARAAEQLLSLVRADDVVLVKGSRGMHLELVVRALVACSSGSGELPAQPVGGRRGHEEGAA